MQYMIHACPERMWYVEEFLIPALTAQGIRDEEITVWIDADKKGNLFSCMDSFLACGDHEGGTWHMQDDVIACSDFASRTKEHDQGIVCGFGCKNFGPSMQERGIVPAGFLWYSFQCIRIPNEIAKECAEWFYNEARYYPQYKEKVADRKHDDYFFREFILDKWPDIKIENLDPCLVDHIDYLIGGTLINRLRAIKINRAAFWPEEDLVEQLEREIERRKH